MYGQQKKRYIRFHPLSNLENQTKIDASIEADTLLNKKYNDYGGFIKFSESVRPFEVHSVSHVLPTKSVSANVSISSSQFSIFYIIRLTSIYATVRVLIGLNICR